jgi:copper chaperone
MRFLICLAVAGPLALAAGCETTPKRSTDRTDIVDGAIDTETATLLVHGMGCPLCANNVDKQLLAVPGVERVNVDMGTGRVTVHLNRANPPTRHQLASAVDDSGFTLVSISTP